MQSLVSTKHIRSLTNHLWNGTTNCYYNLNHKLQEVMKTELHDTIHWKKLNNKNKTTTLCLQKKLPTFKLSVTLSNVNRFSKFLHCWKAYEICYKTYMALPPHLRRVATLPWKIKNSNFMQIFSRYVRICKQVAFLSPLTLLLIHKF